MITTSRLGLALISLALVPLAARANPGWWLPPLKINVTFRFDVHSVEEPRPSAPWWAYFPQDPHQAAHAVRPTFPHWPASFQAQPASAPRLPVAAPNIVYDVAPHALQPASYYQAPPPSYWYGR